MARRRYQNGCVFRRGKNWVLRYREDVRNADGTLTRLHRSVVLGVFPNRREALQAADANLRDLNQGIRLPQTTLSFGEFWRRYFDPEILVHKKFATKQVYGYLAKVHVLPHFESHRLCDISRFDVQAFLNGKRRQQYAPKTLRHFRSLLSKVFGVAQSWGWLNANPAKGVELPPLVKRRAARVLTIEEIARLSQALGEPARTIFILGILTGLRIGEIIALKLEDVDLSTNLVHVRRNIYRGQVQDSPKTEESERRVPLALVLTHAVKGWLAIRPSGSDWFFPNSAGKAFHDDRNLMRREIKPVCRKIGIAPFGWHSLRHTFSTYNGNSGVPMPVLQSLLGHRDAATTMIYTHPLAGAQRDAVEQLASVLFPIVPNFQAEPRQGGSLIQ